MVTVTSGYSALQLLIAISYVQGCSGDERQLADNIANAVSPGREVVKIRENAEPEDFWAALGGKAEYANSKWLAQELPSNPPRLFQCSNASGKFNVEEIFDFAQDVSQFFFSMPCSRHTHCRILLKRM